MSETFAEMKERLGGNVSSIMKHISSLPYKIYFTETGEITYFGNSENVEVMSYWHTHEFTQEQLAILKDVDVSKYYVRKDKLVDNLYSIEQKTFELKKRTQQHLEEITKHIEEADLNCELHKDRISFYLGKDIKKQIGDSDLNAKNLRFFITAKGDPHWLFKSITIPTEKILKRKISVRVDINEDRNNLSVYTKKAFDTYALKVL